MTTNNILDYVGDDGEFIYAIDDYAEDMLAGKLKKSYSFEDSNDWVYQPIYDAKSYTWVVKFFAFAIVLTTLLASARIAFVIHSDQSLLREHSNEILSKPMYEYCTADLNALIDTFFVYTVASDEIHVSRAVSPTSSIEIRVPSTDHGWYQLKGYDDAGEGIVLAKYFTDPVCE